jgi:hypothetical protein
MLAFSKIANLFSGGLAPAPQFPAAAPAAPPAPPATNPPADISLGDISFDGQPPFPSIEEFLTKLDKKYAGQWALLQYIPCLKNQGFFFIDDLLHVDDPLTKFKETCDMEIGTTSFIIHSCQKEVKRMKDQLRE